MNPNRKDGLYPYLLKKLTVEDVHLMQQMRSEGMDRRILAKTFNVHITTVDWHSARFDPELN